MRRSIKDDNKAESGKGSHPSPSQPAPTRTPRSAPGVSTYQMQTDNQNTGNVSPSSTTKQRRVVGTNYKFGQQININVGDQFANGIEQESQLPIVLITSAPEGTPKHKLALAAPMNIGDGATFPDGTAIQGRRVFSELTLSSSDGSDPVRIFGIRFGAELFIFAPEGEEATARAMYHTARVYNGIPLRPEEQTPACIYSVVDHEQGGTQG